MLFTVFCRILNILKNHAFWQTIRIWFEDNFTFLGPCSYDPISPRFGPRSPPYEPRSAHFITPSPRPDPRTEARRHSEENPCLPPSHRPEAGHIDRPVTSSEQDILTYSLGSEVEGNPPEAVSPAKAAAVPGGFAHGRSHGSPHSSAPEECHRMEARRPPRDVKTLRARGCTGARRTVRRPWTPR